MKKKILIFSVIFQLSFSVSAQMLTFDSMGLAQAIQNGYTMYQQLESAYTQMENTYKQLEIAMKNAQSFDVSSFSSSWFDMSAWNNMNGAENEMFQKMKDIENVVKNKSMTINGINFSIEDLYTTNVVSKLGKVAESYASKRLENLSKEEKEQFKNDVGISVDDYNKMEAVSTQLSRACSEAEGKIEATKDYVDTLRDNLTNFSGIYENETGETALMQYMGKNLTSINTTLLNVLEASQDTVKIVNNYINRQEKELQAMQNALNEEQVMGKEELNFFSSQLGDENSYLQFGNAK